MRATPTQEQYDSLAAHAHEQDQRLAYLQVQAQRASSLEVACNQMQQRLQDSDARASALQEEVHRLQGLLEAEATLRQQAESLLQAATAESSRLTHAREQLAGQVMVAERRATEAEEDLLKSEADVAAMRGELHSLQQGQLPAASRTAPPPTAASSDMVSSLERALQQERERGHALSLALQVERSKAQSSIDTESAIPVRPGPPSVASADDSLADDSPAADVPPGQHKAVQRLTQRVHRLKASRDKLLSQVDRQSAELEQLHIANVTLEKGQQEVRGVAHSWERQTQEALQTVEHLKNLLAEGADWVLQHSSAAPEDKSATLETALLQQQAKEAALQLQVAALCAELTRAADVTGDLGRSVLPALSGIEGRLTDMRHLAALPLSQASGDALAAEA
ncbi:hypothetical protein WJX73_003104 [Symbiochloris irregularis]|uniref:Uncharacterized protein n=1 Tax=Symbiochloris irregularis TaxID=706552 RepID=A0AAW1NPQ0_9CHLO